MSSFRHNYIKYIMKKEDILVITTPPIEELYKKANEFGARFYFRDKTRDSYVYGFIAPRGNDPFISWYNWNGNEWHTTRWLTTGRHEKIKLDSKDMERFLTEEYDKKMNKKQSQSVVDFLIDMFPQFSGKVKRGKTFVDAKAANCLYSIWNNEKNQLSSKTLKVTSNVKESDLALMQQEGLVNKVGSNIEITEKGKEIIKIMILGDEKSIFDKIDKQIDFKTASSNVDSPSKLKKNKKKLEDIWWGDIFRK